MKLTINQEEFSKYLNICLRAIALRPNLPILSNVLIRAKNKNLELSTTNLEIGILISIPAKIQQEGETTTNTKIVTEYISSLPKSEINLNLESNMLIFKSDGFGASFNTASPSEFPVIPKTEDKEVIVIESQLFFDACQQVVFAAAGGEGRIELTGVLMEAENDSLRFVATDGYRLSFRTIKLDKLKNNFKIIIPAKTINEALRVIGDIKPKEIKIFMAKDQNQIIFKIDNINLVSRLIDREFPAWEKIVPAEFKTRAVVKKEDFLQATKLASVLAKDAGNVVKIKLNNSKVEFSATAKEYGQNQGVVDAKIDGEGGEIAFNFHYLSDILANLDDESFVFEMNESLNPVKFSGGSKKSADFYHIIMPVRIQS